MLELAISALLKSEHPDWSPAAIKSAIMTTAGKVRLDGEPIMDERYLPANIFAIGSGHVNPSKASDPGLIFDIQPDDYIPYLCGMYSSKEVGIIVQKRVTCTEFIPQAELNYPSYAVTLGSSGFKNFTRTVTNVGVANSTYTITSASIPSGLLLEAVPATLTFSELNQKLTYQMWFIRDNEAEVKALYGEGYLTWSSGKHSVTTVFSIKFV